MVTSIGMLHIGVVFAVFGIFLIGAGILPDDMSKFDLFGGFHLKIIKTKLNLKIWLTNL